MRKHKLAGRGAEAEKKKSKQKAKKTFRRILLTIGGGIGLLCTGYFLGVHHRVIAAMIKGEEPPKAPKGHCWH